MLGEEPPEKARRGGGGGGGQAQDSPASALDWALAKCALGAGLLAASAPGLSWSRSTGHTYDLLGLTPPRAPFQP